MKYKLKCATGGVTMKYKLKCATGLFRIRCKASKWMICKRGTSIPRETDRPLTTFAGIYRAYHAFGLI